MTPTQEIVYNAIVEYEKQNGRYPKQSDICKALCRNRESIRQHVESLIKKGFVEKVKTEEKRIRYIHPTRLIIKKPL